MNPWDKAEKIQKKDAAPAPAEVKEPLREPAPAPKAEEHKEVVEERTQSPQILVSHTDAYIHDRLRSQPKSLEDIDTKVVTERPEGVHRLSLPDELIPYGNRYVFRWVYKVKRAIDEACDVKGWVIANRSYFPDLPQHLFTANGSIERGDNILTFMPKKRAEELRMKPQERAQQLKDSTFGKHKGDPRYYVPKDEETEDRVVGI